jgi:hypothetical protein
MSVIEKKVEQLKETGIVELERLNYRLSDAIREGCSVTGKAQGWVDEDENMCAMSAAVTAAKARGFM